MDRKKLLKKEIVNNIKMSDMINTDMKFKDFKGNNNFNAKIDPFIKTTRDEVENLLTSSKHGNQYLFEWLDYKSKVKPYYDIDMFYTDFSEHKKQIPIIEKEVVDILRELYPETCVAISSSHGEKIKIKTTKGVKKEIKGYAVSYHFVLSDYETTVQELRDFNEANKLYDLKFKDSNEKIFDKSVYRDGGNMRFLFSYKPNDKRQKIPVTYTDKYMWSKHIIQSNDETNHFKRPLPSKSPPSSPPISPKPKVVEVQEEVQEQEIEEDLPPFQPLNEYNLNDITDCLKHLVNEDCFEYETWIKIGMAIHNITDGDMVGLGLFIDYSKKDEDNFDLECIQTNWKYWSKSKDNGKKKVGMTTLKKLAEEYKPIDLTYSCGGVFKKYVYEQFKKNEDMDDIKYSMFFEGGRRKVLQYLNSKLIFVKETGDYIILDNKIIRKENEELINLPCWYLKTPTKAKDHFKKEMIKVTFKDEEFKMNPFEEWCQWIERREVRAIGFDPRDNSNTDLFNLWNGFNIQKEDTDTYHEEDAEPILHHIKELWCQNDETKYNYILDLFAHYIQKPHIKTGVLLALKSKQGGGKGIILNKLAEIIGENHYTQNSNAKFLFGDFNGQLEAKLVVNLDEAFWGGDKQLEGIVKNKITEKRQTINKKNKENYIIDDYANYIITTNNDWFSGVSADDRRHYCLELSDCLSGRMTKNTLKRVQPVLDAPAEAFAKVLYNRDITDFQPRMFKKTKLLQDQVERNWNSVKTWFHMVLKDGGLNHPVYGFAEWGKLWEKGFSEIRGGRYMKNKSSGEKQTFYYKEFLFDCYNSTAADNRKFGVEAFYREFKLNCLKDIYEDKRVQMKNKRRVFVILPDINIAREKWNEVQEFDYEYINEDEDWGAEDYDYGSDDE